MSVISINTNPIAYSIIAKAIRKTESFDTNVLLSTICEILENTYKENELDDKLEELGMSTTKDILTAIDFYIKDRYPKHVTGKTILTKEVKTILNKAISRVKSNDKEIICNEVLRILTETFTEEKLEYKSIKLGLSSKEQILKMVNLYLYNYDDKEKNYRNVCSFLF